MTTTTLTLLETAVRRLSQLDPDGAGLQNDIGWSARESALGHSLAHSIGRWTPAQARAAWKILTPYRHTQVADLDIPAYPGDKAAEAVAAANLEARAKAEAANASDELSKPGWGLSWSTPRLIDTQRGPKMVTSATIPSGHPFWAHWRANKAALVADGYGVRQHPGTGAWQVGRFTAPATVAAAPTPPQWEILPLSNPNGLLDYQIEATAQLVAAVRWCGAALDASDTGTGKTYTTLAACRELGVTPLVVCPKSAPPTWRRAAEHFGVALRGTVTYEKVRRGTSEWGKWVGENFVWAPGIDCIIWDEVHRCKSHKTQNGKVLAAAKRQGIKVLGASATAVQSPLDLKALGYVLGLHPYKGFWAWTERYGCRASRWGGYEFDGNPKHLLALNREIFPRRGVRVRKTDPGVRAHFKDNLVSVETVEVEGLAELVEAYEEAQAAVDAIHARQQLDAEHHLTKILRARQLSELRKLPIMIERAIDWLDEGMSVVLFVNFTDTRLQLESALRKEGHETRSLYGGQSSEDRDQGIADFQADKVHVIIVLVGAGGENVSLHDLHGNRPRGSLISPPWSARQLVQAEGRIARAKAKTPAVQQLLYAAGTIEERVAQVVQANKDNLALLNDGDTAVIKGATIE